MKVASRCNLDCTYCYVYNKGDTSWRDRPALMSDEIFSLTLDRIADHCRDTGQTSTRLVFHGGEPTLAGLDRFSRWCDTARDRLSFLSGLSFSLQTNGTRIDRRWADLLKAHEFSVGVSLDGPPDLNDRARLTHKGKGSHALVQRGIEHLRTAEVPFGILCVTPLEDDPVRIHRHFVDLGPSAISYLLPDHTHDDIAQTRGGRATRAADVLIAIFDDWWDSNDTHLQVRPFTDIARLILGAPSQIDSFGNAPLSFLFIEPDGDIEGLDVLKICEDGLANTGCNVRTHAIGDVAASTTVAANLAFRGAGLPSGCRTCPEALTCGGGYAPHRYRRGAGFDHPSAWCADLKAVFRHMRDALDVSPAETTRRAAVLKGFADHPLQRPLLPC